MIQFIREDKTIKVKVQTTIGNGWYWQPSIELDSEPYAILLRDQMAKDMQNKLSKIREESYLQGWKDTKAKSKKSTWFSGWW